MTGGYVLHINFVLFVMEPLTSIREAQVALWPKELTSENYADRKVPGGQKCG